MNLPLVGETPSKASQEVNKNKYKIFQLQII